MKRLFIALLILTMLLFTLPVFGQDASTAVPTDTDTPAETAESTVEPTADSTAEVVTATPENTPFIIVITPPPPVDPEPPVETGGSVFANLGWVLFLLTLSALAFVLVTWIRELRKSAAAGDQNSKNLLAFVNATQSMLPVDAFVALIDNLEKRAKTVPTPGEVDDKVAAQIRSLVYEILGRELPTETTTPPPAVSPQG